MENGTCSVRPALYIHVAQATHFLRWELPEFSKYFTLVSSPSDDAILLSFGPDILKEASQLPAKRRYANLFPGFSYNPVYNIELRKVQLEILNKYFRAVFINKGPLEIAYKTLKNIEFYPFSVDIDLVKMKGYRKHLDSLIHISSESPQKDWERSRAVMEATGLKYEVFPPRQHDVYQRHIDVNAEKNRIRKKFGFRAKPYLPYGYLNHELVVKKYQAYDGFVHVARDIKDQVLIDGKYTASLIEAGVTGSLLFWHDTFGLGNNLETVFNLSLDPDVAAREILDIKSSLDIKRHSRLTHEEMMDTFNPQRSVEIRALKMLESI